MSVWAAGGVISISPRDPADGDLPQFVIEARPTLLELFPSLGQTAEFPEVKEISPLSPHTHSMNSWLSESLS